MKPKIIIPTEPPTEFEFCHDPPTLNSLELDIVKLTAQFVARNGRSFLTQLMQKEAKNYQFDFLRPQHTLFQHFSKLVEQYNKGELTLYTGIYYLVYIYSADTIEANARKTSSRSK